MQTSEPDSSLAALEALDDSALFDRIGRPEWGTDPLRVSSEQVFRLFKRAREAGNSGRTNKLSEVLTRRLLRLGKAFARRSGMWPELNGDLDDAAADIAQYVWDRLLHHPKDAAHAEKYFGQLFRRRASDAHFAELTQVRERQRPEGDVDQSLEDVSGPGETVAVVMGLRHDLSATEEMEAKAEVALAVGRLQVILTKHEFSAYVMRHYQEMSVNDIADALRVTPRTINTRMNAAEIKVRKEFDL